VVREVVDRSPRKGAIWSDSEEWDRTSNLSRMTDVQFKATWDATVAMLNGIVGGV